MNDELNYYSADEEEGIMQSILLNIASHLPFNIEIDEFSREDNPRWNLRFHNDTNIYNINSSQHDEIMKTIEEVSTHEEIPVNSKSVLINEYTSRFSSAIWYEKVKEKVIILAGLGGIGSYVGFLLSRMHPKSLFIYDPDIVETVNMSGQLYSSEDIGSNKTRALSQMMDRYSYFTNCFAVNERFGNDSEASDIMICGFDNMAARRLFFTKWVHHVKNKSEEERKDCLFIDGRLAAEEFQVFCIRGDDEFNLNRYATEFLFDDEEAEETICSYKQTSFMANMIASVMVNLFTNFVANQCEPLIDRYLPFFTSYSAELMCFTTEV